MKVRIDENLAFAHRRILEAAGHDVADVHDERIAGATDDVLLSHVIAEGRLLVTWMQTHEDSTKSPCRTFAVISTSARKASK